MKKLKLLSLAAIGLSGALMGCTEDISLAEQVNEDYVKSFIERYGLPGEGNTFNMAKHGQVTVKTSKPTNVEVVASEDGKNYSFAYRSNVMGTETIDFDIPASIDEVMLFIDGMFYPTKVGATFDLDHSVRSRGSRDGESWTDLVLAEGKTITTYDESDYDASSKDGRVIFDITSIDEYAKLSHNEGCFNHLGSSLKKYVCEDANTYAKYGNVNDGFTFGTGEHFFYIANVNKPVPEHTYEIGLIYGNGNLKNENHIHLIPIYRTDEVDGASVIHEYYGRADDFPFEKGGFSFIIDFANLEWEFVETEHFRTNNQEKYYAWGFVNDNIEKYGENSLEAKLQRHAQAIADKRIPLFDDLRSNGATDFSPNLPKIDEVSNPWEFYGKYDEYMWSWLNAHTDVKADIDEYPYFRELLAAAFRELPEHAIPYVVKEGDHKYRITYHTAYVPNGHGESAHYTTVNGESLCEIINNHIYCYKGYNIINPGDKNFAFYMKDINTGEIVSTGDANRTKRTESYIDVENETARNGFYFTMLDFDGDGLYNDLVFQNAIPGGYNDGPTFDNYTWYLACEDLGGTGDCDFNDAVFALQYGAGQSINSQFIKVSPLAAGGVYPIYLMWSDGTTDYMVGKELHAWLGNTERDANGHLPFINTNCEAYTEQNYPAATFEYELPAHNGKWFSLDNYIDNLWGTKGTMAGFWVLVDKDDVLKDIANKDVTFSICNTAEILAKYPESMWKVNNNPIDEKTIVPQMMLVTNRWEWPREKMNIELAYPKWTDWIGSSTPTKVQWYGYGFDNAVRDNVVKRW